MADAARPVILIVDDALFVLKRINELISEMADVDVIHAASGRDEAMSLIRTNLPDIIILEMNFGGSHGREIIQFVKSEYPHIKVIIASNKATADYRQRSFDIGADGFFDKSTEFEKIPELIRSFSRK